MYGLNLQQTFAVIFNLVFHRMQQLRLLRTAQPYIDRLRLLLPQLEAAVTRAAADRELDRVNGLARHHVQIGSALSLALRAQAADLLADISIREAAKALYEKMIDGRLGVAHTFAARVSIAIDAPKQRDGAQDLLALLPASTVALVDAWVEAGDAIVDAMAARTARDDDQLRPTLEVVNDARSTLARLRAAIRDEVAYYDDLPANLEEKILGFADELMTRRRKSSTNPEPEAETESAPPEVEPEVDDEPAPPLPLHGPEAHTDHS